MPGRRVLIRIAQVTALAAVAALALTIILLRSDGDGDRPDPAADGDWPEPPNEDARVIAEEDGWFVALDDELANPYDEPRVWVMVEGLLDDPIVTEPPPIAVEFAPIDIDFDLPDDIPLRFTRETSSYLPPSDSGWFRAIVALNLPEGQYDLVITRKTDERVLAREEVSIAYTEKIEGIAIQYWDAEAAALQAMEAILRSPGFHTFTCGTDPPFDESAGYWTVTCELDGVTTEWTVDAQTGELTQTGGPSPDELGES